MKGTHNQEAGGKTRCWRLEYADDLSFHMDIVPVHPETYVSKYIEKKRRMIVSSRLDEALASDVSALAVSITDNTDDGYKAVSDGFDSNPEGYTRWFENRMRTAAEF